MFGRKTILHFSQTMNEVDSCMKLVLVYTLIFPPRKLHYPLVCTCFVNRLTVILKKMVFFNNNGKQEVF